MVNNDLQNEILQKCLENYNKTKIPKASFIFGFNNDIRINYFDTLDYMYDNNLIEPNYLALGSAIVVLTDIGLQTAKDLFE